MAGERLTLSPILDDSSNSPLELSGQDGSLGNGLLLMDHQYPMPPTQPQWVSSADTEGELLANTRYGNRTIGVTLRVAEPQDAASTNLATNPKCAVDTTGWTNSGMASIARTVLYGSEPDGLAGVGSDTALKTVGNSDLDLCYIQAPVTNTKTYTFSAWVYLSANSATGVRLLVNKGGGSDAASSATFSTLNAWTRLSVSFTADATTTWWFAIEQIGAGATTAYTTGVLIEQAPLGNYFDGDSPGCAWSGTHHASTSTRPAPGGNRLLKITDDLQEAVDRLNREGGVLMRVSPGGEPIFFDCSEAQIEFDNDNALLFARRTTAKLSFTAKPFWRGVWTTLTDHVETALPCIVGTDTINGGQVPSLGRLVADDDQAKTQKWLVWGLQSRYYSSSADAALFYEAEGRTAIGGAATAVRSGASGGGSNVVRHTTLIGTNQAILSTQATGGGNHLQNIGTFRVFARVYDSNATQGNVKLALQWATGDFIKRTTNAAVSPTVIGDFSFVDLGYISIPKISQGTQRWEGRILASSTNPGDDIDIDYLMLIPTDEGAGQITAVDQAGSTGTLQAYDTFLQAAGVVASGAAPQGGNYDPGTAGASTAEDGDTDDFSFSGSPNFNITRNPAGADSSLTNGRYIQLDGSSTIAAVEIQIDVSLPVMSSGSQEVRGGVLARFVDTDNWLMAVRRCIRPIPATTRLSLYKRVAGTVTTLGDVLLATGSPSASPYTVKLAVDAAGNASVYTAAQGATLGAALITVVADANLATGGALDDGKIGFYDASDLASAGTRTYDNFVATTSATTLFDAAMFASQSVQIGPDSVLREDSGGTIWQPPGKYEGAYLRLPATGREDRTVRVIVKATRLDPTTGADSNIDDISYQLQHAPRGITLPEPT